MFVNTERRDAKRAARNSACPHAPMRFRSKRLSTIRRSTSDSREFVIHGETPCSLEPSRIQIREAEVDRSIREEDTLGVSREIRTLYLESLYLESSESRWSVSGSIYQHLLLFTLVLFVSLRTQKVPHLLPSAPLVFPRCRRH